MASKECPESEKKNVWIGNETDGRNILYCTHYVFDLKFLVLKIAFPWVF